MDDREEEPFSPMCIQSKPNLPNNRPSSDIMEFENPSSPVSKKSGTDIDYAELDLEQPPTPPVRQSSSQNQHRALRQVMSTPAGASYKTPAGYIELSFGGPPPETTVAPPPVKPLPPAKQRYGYSTVVLSPEVEKSKDVEKAAELKQKKPHPGIPARYGESSPPTSTSSLEGSAREEPPVPSARKSPATKPRGVAVLPVLPGQNATVIIEDEQPPVPPPRVSNNISNDDRVYVNVQSQPPAVPLR